MDFNKIIYTRPDYDTYKENITLYISELKNTRTFEEFDNLFNKINKLRDKVQTMKVYSEIRYSINTKDSFYEKENVYWDEKSPLYDSLDNIFYRAVLGSTYKINIIEKYGQQYYRLLNCRLKSFSDKIIYLLQKENILMSQYTRLLASAKILFDNKICNLSDLSIYMSSNDEKIRRSSIKAHTSFFEENEDKFDSIFDQLVKIRHEMAKRMGYENFIELAYYRMDRTDYNPKMVDQLRKNVRETYISQVNKIYKNQAKRIGVDKISYYDEKLDFLEGNAKLVGDGNYIIEQGKIMYSQMSNESKEFYDFLTNNNLFDVEARESKAMGGYCTFLNSYREPFIFGNFNGSVDDIDVLTHEAGHALQMYLSREIKVPELLFPTLDTCEIHSMSMEFFTYPWMKLFFGEDEEKYKTYHYESAIKFLPYGCLVDHFQHEIYKNPNMSPVQRKNKWRELEKIYMPNRDYQDLDLLDRGGYWFRQGHIYKDPFYYIDYVLAQLCALELYELMQVDYKKAWSIYIKMCKVGGEYSFIELVENSGLKNPFKEI
ncbi:M3 family oligoendopeptidase [Peptostreptococcus equinus]|uniref:M3 family oligoendopeptidase n=1 Tax=Peptostreptococcus equinus TaxID=3003601 RepID=A0ABY7JKZ9_9FIRM|nr:M3 family oligoendopeptidase [Peptostreptococcus sp. CBA3647]WAW14023.1 M3 family oligoendopeptidase [Peptostreptococcus sp. CBA3647]